MESDSADAFLWALMQTGDLRTLVAMLKQPERTETSKRAPCGEPAQAVTGADEDSHGSR